MREDEEFSPKMPSPLAEPECDVSSVCPQNLGKSCKTIDKGRDASSHTLRWRKGELIGCGAYGRVYMGMDLDSGELLAVKQVSFAANHGSREKAQAHIRELEEEVKLLRNLTHPHIVRYLGTAREEEALNILLEFVPGGSISSLLGKFGSFTEPVIRKYTKQLLQGLEYLHSNGIMHRDIKGANILVDNKGCIKLADFGASKKVVELATMSGAKSMKGTPYWMAPEVIRQTGHGLSADIWSVGCTIIEMATGKPPWASQLQEVAALFHIGTTKSHPPIPEHLSAEAKDFLQQCLMKEPNLRPTAAQLLQHPFITGIYREPHPLMRSSTTFRRSGMFDDPSRLSMVRSSFWRSPNVKGDKEAATPPKSSALDRSLNFLRQSTSFIRSSLDFNGMLSATKSIQDMPNLASMRSRVGRAFSVRQSASMNDPGLSTTKSRTSNMFSGDEDSNCSVRLDSIGPDFPTNSFNPMSEPFDEDEMFKTRESGNLRTSHAGASTVGASTRWAPNTFSFQCGRSVNEDDDEVTESKIRAFLDEKALELKKLQTPLYEEFYNTTNAAIDSQNNVGGSGSPLLPVRCNSPHSRSSNADSHDIAKRISDVSINSGSPARSIGNVNPLAEITGPILNEWQGHQDAQQQPTSPSVSERQRLWKEELDRELESKREEMRRRFPSHGGRISSPGLRQRDKSPAYGSPTK